MVLAPSSPLRVSERLLETVSSPDFRSLLITSLAMVSYVEGIKLLAHHKWLGSKDARKLLHIGCGPIFMLCWPLFSSSPAAASFAAMAPLSITSFFMLVGLGLVKDEATVRSMSRSGVRSELLRGPIVYGTVITLATVLFWRRLTSVVTIISLCAGDGFADIVGRRFGQKHKIPWCPRKSYAGSLGFIVASLAMGGAFGLFFHHLGWTSDVPLPTMLLRVTAATVVAALVETLPIEEWDNLTVFAAALATDCLAVCGGKRGGGEGGCRRALLASAWK